QRLASPERVCTGHSAPGDLPATQTRSSSVRVMDRVWQLLAQVISGDQPSGPAVTINQRNGRPALI
ncbi:MAG: hypothetical protein PVI98_13755, partial [Burkholderiales bacterium]